jgi:hypothetical protein
MLNRSLLGASDYAKNVEKYESAARSEIYNSGSASKIPALYTLVDSAWRAALKDGWDGANTKAVSYLSMETANAFVKVFPIDTANTPEIYADPNGAIEFEWQKGTESLNVLIKDRRIVYSAFLNDDQRNREAVQYKDQFPLQLISLISYFK